ncbi:MAG: GNAT family N-acetyltransferase [Acidimicrobiales bacterium]
MAVTIRVGRPEDGPTLQAIERLAGARFRDVGLDDVADHDPMSVQELADYARSGRSWVAVTEGGIVGYALVDVVDGGAHLEQISVRPAHQGTGIGRALMAEVETWALDTLDRTVTLTTFRDVPWNQPLYEHLGYRALTDDEIGPGLRALLAVEAEHGLDPARRVAMRKDLIPSPPPKRLEPFAVLTLLAGLGAVTTVVLGFWGLLALVAALALHTVADHRIKARPTARRGRKLANVGLGIALVGVILGMGVFLFGPHARRGDYAISSLKVGECFDDLPDSRTPARDELRLVSCEQEHLGEVILNEKVDGDVFPGRDALHREGNEHCGDAYLTYVGRSVKESMYTEFSWEPSESGWERGLRSRVCTIRSEADDAELPPGSLEGADR